MKQLVVLLVFSIGHLLFDTCAASAQDVFQMSNGLNQPLHLWFLPRGANEYLKPPTFLPRGGTVPVSLVLKEYYLAVLDLAGNQDHLNYIDFEKLSRKAPNAKLRVTGGYVTECRTEMMIVTICKPVFKEVLRKEIERRPVIGGDGRKRYEYVEVERVYRHTEMVPVQETQQRQVSAPRLRVDLAVEKDGRLIPVREILGDTIP